MSVTEKVCPWVTSTDTNDVLECVDGFTCNVNTNSKKWSCCTEHNKRQKCPKNYPVMCAAESCGQNNTDYCCSTEKGCRETFDGLRECDGKCNYLLIFSSYTKCIYLYENIFF